MQGTARTTYEQPLVQLPPRRDAHRVFPLIDIEGEEGAAYPLLLDHLRWSSSITPGTMITGSAWRPPSNMA
jgi:hypothetical protein